MNVEVNFDPTQVQQKITEAILNSSIGEAIQKAVETQVKQWNVNSYWDNGVNKAVEGEIRAAINNSVATTFRPLIEARIKDLLTDELIDEIIRKGLQSVLKESRGY